MSHVKFYKSIFMPSLFSPVARFKVVFFHTFLWVLGILAFTGCAGTKKSRTARIEKVILTARSYTGTPYKFGGMSRSGMDCSGLLVLSFKSAGLSIPRTSKEQSKVGKAVSKDELRPGDLLFFAAKKRSRKITHAGMVTDVRGAKSVKFIHSSTKLGVVEADFFVNYYQDIFVKARRPNY